jgi:hypothetical protein
MGKDVQKAAETPYVVMFQAVNLLAGDGGGVSGMCGPPVQDCWEFEHPRRDVALDSRGTFPFALLDRVVVLICWVFLFLQVFLSRTATMFAQQTCGSTFHTQA